MSRLRPNQIAMMVNEIPTLKPCPFCSSWKVGLYMANGDSSRPYVVQCDSCLACGSWEMDEGRAQVNWNRAQAQPPSLMASITHEEYVAALYRRHQAHECSHDCPWCAEERKSTEHPRAVVSPEPPSSQDATTVLGSPLFCEIGSKMEWAGDTMEQEWTILLKIKSPERIHPHLKWFRAFSLREAFRQAAEFIQQQMIH